MTRPEKNDSHGFVVITGAGHGREPEARRVHPPQPAVGARALAAGGAHAAAITRARALRPSRGTRGRC